MTGCKKIDMDTWARREHYEYYTKQLKVEYNITANVDVKNVLDFLDSFYYRGSHSRYHSRASLYFGRRKSGGGGYFRHGSRGGSGFY